MNEVRRYAPYVPCPTCTANRPRLCDLHYQQRAEAFLQAVKHAIADPRTPDGVKATYEELLAQNRSLAARVQRAETSLRGSGWTYLDGAEAWKPPLGPSASPLLQTIDELQARVQAVEQERDVMSNSREALVEVVRELRQQLAEAQATVARQQDRIDLQCDEFQRIAAIAGNDEIKGLCDRAVKDIRQHVPVIQQRDQAEQQVARLREAVVQAKEFIGCGVDTKDILAQLPEE